MSASDPATASARAGDGTRTFPVLSQPGSTHLRNGELAAPARTARAHSDHQAPLRLHDDRRARVHHPIRRLLVAIRERLRWRACSKRGARTGLVAGAGISTSDHTVAHPRTTAVRVGRGARRLGVARRHSTLPGRDGARRRAGTGVEAAEFRRLVFGATWLATGRTQFGQQGHAVSLQIRWLGIWFVLVVPVIGGLIYGPRFSGSAVRALRPAATVCRR